jgi:hypothetical protein
VPSIPLNASYAEITKKIGDVSKNRHHFTIRLPSKSQGLLNAVRKLDTIIPVKFKKVYIQLNYIPVLRIASRKARVKIMYKILTELGIKQKVKDFSFIGKSVLELYVAEPVYQEVLSALVEQNVNLITNFDATAVFRDRSRAEMKDFIISRCGFLYSRQHLRNMKLAIIEDFDENLQDAIKRYAERFHAEAEHSTETATSVEMDIEENISHAQ